MGGGREGGGRVGGGRDDKEEYRQVFRGSTSSTRDRQKAVFCQRPNHRGRGQGGDSLLASLPPL